MKYFYAKYVPLIVETTTISAGGVKRELRPGWKSYACPKCWCLLVYIGRRPKHKCHKPIICTSISAEKELVSVMAKEIEKEIKKRIKKKCTREYYHHSGHPCDSCKKNCEDRE